MQDIRLFLADDASQAHYRRNAAANSHTQAGNRDAKALDPFSNLSHSAKCYHPRVERSGIQITQQPQ
jgi:hypothetical protein